MEKWIPSSSLLSSDFVIGKIDDGKLAEEETVAGCSGVQKFLDFAIRV